MTVLALTETLVLHVCAEKDVANKRQ